jgi:hypothetical protein
MTDTKRRTAPDMVYIVRHCHATGQGQEPGAPLSAIGFQQAMQLARRFSCLIQRCRVNKGATDAGEPNQWGYLPKR